MKMRSASTSTACERGSKLEIKKPSTDILVKELRVALRNLEASLQEIEEGRFVSQEVLNLEFRI